MFQFLLSFTFLSIASAFDLKNREVPNRIWLIFLPISIGTTAFNFLLHPNLILLSLISITITSTIAITIFYLGLYGGADAKALITLCVSHPISTSLLLPFPFLPITTFNNSLVLMILTLPFALIKNIHWKITRNRSLFLGLENEPIWKKMGALIFCVKTDRLNIRPYQIIAERSITINGESARSLNIFQKIPEEDTTIDETFPEEVFTVFSLPMLPFLTIAYILSITVGDVIFNLITILLS